MKVKVPGSEEKRELESNSRLSEAQSTVPAKSVTVEPKPKVELEKLKPEVKAPEISTEAKNQNPKPKRKYTRKSKSAARKGCWLCEVGDKGHSH
jgi:hypothetical protein